jgi:hypothetical protein
VSPGGRLASTRAHICRGVWRNPTAAGRRLGAAVAVARARGPAQVPLVGRDGDEVGRAGGRAAGCHSRRGVPGTPGVDQLAAVDPRGDRCRRKGAALGGRASVTPVCRPGESGDGGTPCPAATQTGVLRLTRTQAVGASPIDLGSTVFRTEGVRAIVPLCPAGAITFMTRRRDTTRSKSC